MLLIEASGKESNISQLANSLQFFFCWYVGWSTSGPCSSSLVINFSAWFADIFLKTTRLCDLVNNICFLMSSYVFFRVDSLFVLRLSLNFKFCLKSRFNLSIGKLVVRCSLFLSKNGYFIQTTLFLWLCYQFLY